MASKFFFSLESIVPKDKNPSGSFRLVTSKETPGLVNIAFGNLTLTPRGSVEPLWHPNANKIGYCTEGTALVNMRTPSKAETFTVKQGDIFFIPKGYVHHYENIGKSDVVLNFGFDNSTPETMWLSKAVGSISDSVFNSTFNTQTSFIDGLKKVNKTNPIKTLPPLDKAIGDIKSSYNFNIGSSKKEILTQGGYLQVGTKNTLPTLQGLGILGFGLNPKGIVEPHWHTNAGELVYIVQGKTRITVLSPDGKVEVMEVKAGEGAFAPASHFHNIENIGSDNVEVIAFFNNENPDYLGIGEVVGSFSNELLASVFNVPGDYFNKFKKPEEPLIIVPI